MRPFGCFVLKHGTAFVLVVVVFVTILLQLLDVLTLSAADDGCQQLNAAALGQGEDAVHNLVDGLLTDLSAADGAVRHADASIEKAQKIVNLRNGTNRRAWVLIGGLLLSAIVAAAMTFVFIKKFKEKYGLTPHKMKI